MTLTTSCCRPAKQHQATAELEAAVHDTCCTAHRDQDQVVKISAVRLGLEVDDCGTAGSVLQQRRSCWVCC